MSEMKDEVKPLINQLCNVMIQKNTKIIRAEIQFVTKMLEQKTKDLHQKIDKDVKALSIKNKAEILDLEDKLTKECRLMARKLARDRSDFDRQISQQ